MNKQSRWIKRLRKPIPLTPPLKIDVDWNRVLFSSAPVLIMLYAYLVIMHQELSGLPFSGLAMEIAFWGALYTGDALEPWMRSLYLWDDGWMSGPNEMGYFFISFLYAVGLFCLYPVFKIVINLFKKIKD